MVNNNFKLFTVNDIYAAICDCQLLHPDEQEQLEDAMAGSTFSLLLGVSN